MGEEELRKQIVANLTELEAEPIGLNGDSVLFRQRFMNQAGRISGNSSSNSHNVAARTQRKKRIAETFNLCSKNVGLNHVMPDFILTL